MKFETLFQSLLEATQASSLPYTTDSDGNVEWTRKGGNLEGAPQTVGGNFFCSGNRLQSLEGAPKEVGGNFYCYDNQLQSLEGAPKTVGGGFDCSNNRLQSLEGAPKEVGGNFFCYNNRLQSLEGAPQTVGGNFYCSDNPLKSLKGVPKARSYDLSKGFSEKDVEKEVAHREFEKGLDAETRDTFGDFVAEL